MITLLTAAANQAAVNINWEYLLDKLVDFSISAGKNILVATIVFIVGRLLMSLVKRLLTKTLTHRKVDAGIQSFVLSMVHIALTILLIISVVGALGVETTSFAALLASAGVAVGMALSGNLQNFAGGLVVLLFKPYKVGDFVEAQGVVGTVREIQIFHTILNTTDNKLIYIPNGSMSTSLLINYNRQVTRRLEWTIGIDYGEDVEMVCGVIREILSHDQRILSDPAPFADITALADSSVNIIVRVWVKTEDYWNVYHETLRAIYKTFNERGINFPYPQRTVHLVKD
ncbi:Small-conductance mechanosensitive channel [gut metagenome]|uniref:Small-conductance mechanosensitive channel n=1 Tax=gut metagenome TaxID=749906 RepID=J9H6M4_9ZZZZ